MRQVYWLVSFHKFWHLNPISYVIIAKTRVPFTFDFHLSINIGTANTSLGPFWRNFRSMTSPREPKMQFLRKRSQTQTSHFKVPSNDFDLPITLVTWYTTLDPFYSIWRSWHHKRNKYSIQNLEKLTKTWIWSIKNENG